MDDAADLPTDSEQLPTSTVFGRLEPVKIREHWPDEAQDFTPWLAREENLALLGETLGLNLELVGMEQRVGPFKADIVAKDDEQTVIVENQLDASDHKHLGQLLVYAAGRSANTVVWVAKQMTDEYRKVIDWLNEQTAVNFWALEIELWRIGDSSPAPKFNVVCGPNELTKDAAGENTELSDTKLLQLDFWKAFADYLETCASFNPRKARPQHWYNLPSGTSRANIGLTALANGRIGCELYINHSKASAIFDSLANEKGTIEQELGELEWDPLPERKACRIAIYKQANIQERERWPDLFVWLKDHAESFRTAFGYRVKQVKLPSDEQEVSSPGGPQASGSPAIPLVTLDTVGVPAEATSLKVAES